MAFLNEVVRRTVENPYTATGLKNVVAYMLLVYSLLQLYENISAHAPLVSLGQFSPTQDVRAPEEIILGEIQVDNQIRPSKLLFCVGQ